MIGIIKRIIRIIKRIIRIMCILSNILVIGFCCLYSIFTLLETDIDNYRLYNCYHYYSMGV